MNCTEHDVGKTTARLIGGENDLDTPEANAVVRLLTGCTGTLIAPDIVLTAGHCINHKPPPDITTGADGFNWEEAGRWYPLYHYPSGVEIGFGLDSEAYSHRARATQYNIAGYADIMALRLDGPVPSSIARPMTVLTKTPARGASDATAFWSDQQFQMVGWGAAVTDKLWMRDPVTQDVDWQHIGHANDVVAMTAINGKLFAATSDNGLWMRDPVDQDVDWQYIGHANNVVAMTALNGKLFAATIDNRFWMRVAL